MRERRERRELYALLGSGAAFHLREQVLADPSLVGTTRTVWLPADDDVDMLVKGYIDRSVPEDSRRLSDRQIAMIDRFAERGALEKRFNQAFFTAGDSREPEVAGIRGALVGSALTLLVTLLSSFPIGVGAAVYLEEFAPRNRWTDIIEVNINNLAAVPSIVFGLLGLAVFLNFFSLPRSVPVVGGLVLALMTLPHHHHRGAGGPRVGPTVDPRGGARGRRVADADRAAPRAAACHARHPDRHDHRHGPRARRDGAPADDRDGRVHRGRAAHPLRPGDGPPVQIYLWGDSRSGPSWRRTSAAILVLLGFLIAMNSLAWCCGGGSSGAGRRAGAGSGGSRSRTTTSGRVHANHQAAPPPGPLRRFEVN